MRKSFTADIAEAAEKILFLAILSRNIAGPRLARKRNRSYEIRRLFLISAHSAVNLAL
jgi:hypothetical protein